MLQDVRMIDCLELTIGKGQSLTNVMFDNTGFRRDQVNIAPVLVIMRTTADIQFGWQIGLDAVFGQRSYPATFNSACCNEWLPGLIATRHV